VDVVFGKSFTYAFTPMVGNEPADGATLVSARLYSSYPSLAQVTNTSDVTALQNVVSWRAGNAPGQQLIDFAPVTDPNPTIGGAGITDYWVVVNFTYEAGGPTVYDVGGVGIKKPGGIHSDIYVRTKDLQDLDSKLLTIKGDQWINNKFDAAQRMTIQRLKGLSYQRRFINGEDVNLAIIFQAGKLAALELVTQPNDVWALKAKIWSDELETIWSRTQIATDINQDGKIDEATERNTSPRAAAAAGRPASRSR